MFTDESQQFLRSFGAESQKSLEINQNNNYYKQYENANSALISSVGVKENKSKTRKQSSINEQQRQILSIQEKQVVGELSGSKRISFATKLNKSRRFSEQKNLQFLNKLQLHDDREPSAKSEPSVKDSKQKPESQQQMIEDRSAKSIKQKSEKNNTQQMQGAFMKKIRNLQARAKNMDMNYKTVVLKLKNDNSKLTKQNNSIKQLLKSKYPTVFEELTKYLSDNQESDSEHFLDSSGSSDTNNDQLMPILSKVQEVKFDGQKMVQTIKNCEQKIKKYTKIQTQQQKQLKQVQNLTGSKKILLRKYSIPSSKNRQKKQSFNTANISEAKSKDKEKQAKTVEQQFICANCKQVTMQNR